MTSGEWDEVKARFNEALEHSAETREAFLSQSCSNDTVRREVRRLVEEYRRAGDFLSHGAAAGNELLVSELAGATPNEPSFHTLGRYQIGSLLGEGGMGRVYLAQDTRLRRQVAVKLLLDEFTGSANALWRLRSEAQALSALNHPNICTVHDIGEHEGRMFIVMEYIPGTRLDVLIRQGAMQPNEAMGYAVQIAAGLGAAHAAGIVHRDMKPVNVVITGDGRVKILDFGIAKLAPAAFDISGDGSQRTAQGTIAGTAAYMSPEQAEAKEVDARSDIFSFGCVLFEMISGHRAFARETYIATLSAVLHVEPEPVSRLCPSAPPQLDGVIARCLCKNPEGRFQNAAELEEALKKITVLNATDTKPWIVPKDAADGPSQPLRSRAAIAALWLLALGILGWAAFRSGLNPFHAGLPDKKQIAVLPFNIIGNDAEVRVLSDGLVETLTSKLSEMDEFQGTLVVIPASEVRTRKVADAESARKIYGANLAITGSGQRWGDQIQFTLNLVDTSTLRQIASKTFEFDASKPVTLRDEAVNGALELLALKLSPKTQELIRAGETSVTAANSEYLKGIGYLVRYDVTGNIDRAIESLTEATRLDPGYARAFAALGEARWQKAVNRADPQEKELALQAIRESIRLGPGRAEGHIRLGEIDLKDGKVAEALREEQEALRIAPGNGEPYRILGDLYAKARQDKQAEIEYREALRRAPGDWLAHLQLGILYSDRGQNAAARKELNDALAIAPDNEVAYRILADIDMQEGHFRTASDELAKTPVKNVRTYSALGAAYYYQRRYREAVEAMKAGLALEPNHYSAWGNLGSIYRHMPGHERDARATFQRAVDLGTREEKVDNSDERIHANLGEYKAKLGQCGEAVAEINLIPEASRAGLADQLVLIYESCRDRKRAIETIRQLTLDDPLLPDIRSDPDLELLWREPALARWRESRAAVR